MNTDYPRYAGILMHITSLPSRFGIGDIGKEAYDFVDNLKKTGATLWQILPLGPTGYGNSPYSPRSSFASNELLISLEKLFEDGWIKEEELESYPSLSSDKVLFDKVTEAKLPLLKKAAERFLEKNEKDRKYAEYKRRQKYWIEDYALFMILYEKYADARWYQMWDAEEARRDKDTIERIKRVSHDEMEIWIAMQYFFDMQWAELKNYANRRGIRIIGDTPIFVGADSADTWSHIELFKTDKTGAFSSVSGVPPDNFSSDGQRWGNPVYDWKKHEETDFSWWKERFKRESERVDILRIDHFRGFDAYYDIKSSEKTARNGKWIKAPGRKLFSSLKKENECLNIIAEDLGFITRSVEKLRKDFSFPGMKISQFGFTFLPDGELNTYDTFLPHNYERDFVAYTGTHDNDTTRGWFSSLSDIERHHVREYLASDDNEIVWALIRAIMLSAADYAVIPMQDILELSTEARMNYPSSCNDRNWSWRMRKDAFDDYRINRMRHLVKISGRNGITAEEMLAKVQDK